MTRQWGATGVRELGSETLTQSRRQQIEYELKGRSVEILDRDGFYGAIDVAIASFRTMRRIRGESRPAAVRKNLKSAIDAGFRLNRKLNDLDGNSRLILYEFEEEGIQALQAKLGKIIDALNKAYRAADEYPKKGNLKERERLDLAVAVEVAIERYTNKPPTTTKEGFYTSLLAMVLEDALGREVKAVHALADKAHKYRALQDDPDGSLENIPPAEAK